MLTADAKMLRAERSAAGDNKSLAVQFLTHYHKTCLKENNSKCDFTGVLCQLWREVVCLNYMCPPVCACPCECLGECWNTAVGVVWLRVASVSH